MRHQICDGDGDGDSDGDGDGDGDEVPAWCCILTLSPCISVLLPASCFHRLDQDDPDRHIM